MRHGSIVENEDRWVLDSTTWELIAPNRLSIRLTATEVAVMNMLCSHCGDTCRREDLMAALAHYRFGSNARHLDYLASRLRRKAVTQTSLRVPIKAAYKVGYTFVAPAIVR